MIPEFGRSIREAIGLSEGLPAYFAMLMLGFAVAIGTGVVWAKKSKLSHDVIIDMGLVSLIAGVAGARLMHVFVDGYFMDYVHLCTDPSQVTWHITQAQCVQYEGVWDATIQRCRPAEGDCFAWAKFWQGGLVWYGGLLAAGVYDIYFMRKERFPIGKGLDMAGMMIPLGVFFGRLGCWFGGCCFGLRSDAWGAVSFPPWSPASEAQFRAGELSTPGLPSLPVLPTQLYEAGALLAISAICMLVVHPRKRFDGQVFCISMIGYSVARFLIEFVRADDRGALLWFSTSQWIGLGIVAAAIALWVFLARRAKEKASAPIDEKAIAAV
jgi:phosphatidylglycerol:prolipoprotein diacylglycerol transferase